MSITVELNLPQAVADKAKAEGLLRGEILAGLVERELGRRRARGSFGVMLKQLHSVSGDELSPQEVQAEIDAVRSRRKTHGEGSH